MLRLYERSCNNLTIDDLTNDLGELLKQYLTNPVFKHNLQVLMETTLEHREYWTKHDTMKMAEDMYYYRLKDDERPPQPRVLNSQDSCNLMMTHPKSLCRFGDGEFDIIMGSSISFQEYDEELSNKLKMILSDKNNGGG